MDRILVIRRGGLGDTVLIHCELDRTTCQDPSYADVRWWNVGTLKVEMLPDREQRDKEKAQGAAAAKSASKAGQRFYRVTLLTDERKTPTAKRIQYRDLPTWLGGAYDVRMCPWVVTTWI